MSEEEKLERIMTEVFLLDEAGFRWDLRQNEVATWDSMGTVSLAAAIRSELGVELSLMELAGLHSFADVKERLRLKGINCGN